MLPPPRHCGAAPVTWGLVTAAPPSAEGHVPGRTCASCPLGPRMRGGQVRGAGPGDPVHQLPHPEVRRAAQVGAGAGWGRGQAPGPATRAPARSVCREDLWGARGRILDPEKLFF